MKRSRKGVAITIFLTVVACFAYSQSPVITGTKAAQKKALQTVTPQQRSVDLKNSAEQRLDAIDKHLDAIDKRLGTSDIGSELGDIKTALGDLKKPSLLSTALPAVIAALAAIAGVLFGGYLNERLQRKRMAQEATIADAKAAHEKRLAEDKAQQERELAANQSKLQIGSAVVDWELQQLHLLYGPARALLGQSNGLYSQMNTVLEQVDSERFRFVSGNEREVQSVPGDEFQIKTAEGWKRFRTVLHIDQVYGKGFGVETYFDEIVAIGKRLVKIIEQNAGYARPQEKGLMQVFAKYLAHFAVLKHVHNEAKISLKKPSNSEHSLRETDGVEPLKVDLSAVFPSELHKLINDGFEAVTKDIEQWKAKALV